MLPGSKSMPYVDPDPGKEIEVDPDPERGLKWIRIRNADQKEVYPVLRRDNKSEPKPKPNILAPTPNKQELSRTE